MEEGEIVLIVFPQDAEQKLRPALILREFPKYNDLLICGITSKLSQFIPDFDLLLSEAHPDFKRSGLKRAGVCRLNMLTMISKTQIKGRIGVIGTESLFELRRNLAGYLLKKSHS